MRASFSIAGMQVKRSTNNQGRAMYGKVYTIVNG